MARRFQVGAAKVGISITNDPPHSVIKVTELMDSNGRLQGQPGYCNPFMAAGDVLFAINGVYLNTLPLGGVKDALFGPPNSTVKLHMRRHDGTSYDVVAMRHIAITQAGIDELQHRNKMRAAQRSVLGSSSSTHSRSPPDAPYNSGGGGGGGNSSLYRSYDSNTSLRSGGTNSNPWMAAINNLARCVAVGRRVLTPNQWLPTINNHVSALGFPLPEALHKSMTLQRTAMHCNTARF